MDGLRRPDLISFNGNVAENWRRFELEYDVYIECCYCDKTLKQKAMILLNLAGSEAMERERAFQYLPDESRYDPDTLSTNLKNVIMETRLQC